MRRPVAALNITRSLDDIDELRELCGRPPHEVKDEIDDLRDGTEIQKQQGSDCCAKDFLHKVAPQGA